MTGPEYMTTGFYMAIPWWIMTISFTLWWIGDYVYWWITRRDGDEYDILENEKFVNIFEFFCLIVNIKKVYGKRWASDYVGVIFFGGFVGGISLLIFWAITLPIVFIYLIIHATRFYVRYRRGDFPDLDLTKYGIKFNIVGKEKEDD